MSDAVALDLFIQDFVISNKLLNQHYTWPMLVSRRYLETGVHVFEFQSGGHSNIAVGTHLELPETDWYRIELTREIPAAEHRFDCLRMTFQSTHREMEVEQVPGGPVLIKVFTRNRGLVNIVFVIHPPPALAHPLLAGSAVAASPLTAVHPQGGIPRPL